jgi:hypothetical protein
MYRKTTWHCFKQCHMTGWKLPNEKPLLKLDVTKEVSGFI